MSTQKIMRILLAALVFVSSVAALSCSKEKDGDESIFYGTWVKGSATGDTLRFYQKRGKNILAYSSFNPALPAPTEIEYTYTNGKLYLKYSADPMQIESFEWKQRGREFELLGFELFLFMSSTLTRFHYRKIN